MGKQVIQEDFLKKAKAVHGNRFDYTDTVYVNSSTPIEYRCEHHGIVSQLPHNHYRYGCKQCANEAASLRNRSSSEVFIKKAVGVHQDKYDYSLVKYKNSKTKVEIICKHHNKSWWQIPDSHLRGNGCPLCGGTMKSDTDGFIEKARKIHGATRYDYSESIYTHAHCKLTIICGEHEEPIKFTQMATDHLSGYGCPRCSAEKRGSALRLTTENFVKRAMDKWGGKFSYDKTVYRTANDKIIVSCVKHGDVETHPHTHLTGMAGGCVQCGREQTISKQRFTTEEFVKKAVSVHGDLYCYENTIYNGANENLRILCMLHGEYTQRAAEHLKGSGCNKCGTDRAANKNRDTTESFIEKSRVVHGFLYDYSRVEYKDSHIDVEILCPNSGGHSFFQRPNHHLSGSGCPYCRNGFDFDSPATLYYLKINHENETYYKIGITGRSVDKRFSNKDLEKIEVLREWFFDTGDKAYTTEQLILRDFEHLLLKNSDILSCGGNTEIFHTDIFL